MKRVLKLLGVVLLLLLIAAVWMFWPVRLAMAELPTTVAMPAANPPADMALYALPTGAMHSQAMFAYRGGAVGEPRDFAMTAYLVRHPRGDLLIDTGLGSQIVAQFAQLPWLMRATSEYSVTKPAADQLVAAGLPVDSLAGVLLTHAHWDHVSGLTDLPGVPVWLSRSEAKFVADGSEMAALAHSMPNLVLRPFDFNGEPYLGYPSSYDLWGDGSVVVLPASGHTPGSVHVLVTLPDQRRYFFVGDTVWQSEGISRPAERPWLARSLLAEDSSAVRAQVSHLAALHQRFPEIIMVPAHDARPTSSLPRLLPR